MARDRKPIFYDMTGFVSGKRQGIREKHCASVDAKTYSFARFHQPHEKMIPRILSHRNSNIRSQQAQFMDYLEKSAPVPVPKFILPAKHRPRCVPFDELKARESVTKRATRMPFANQRHFVLVTDASQEWRGQD
jgi:hypothetical protein